MTSFLSILAPDIPYVVAHRNIAVRPFSAAAGCDPERRLVAAIVLRAVRDIKQQRGTRDAVAYVAGQNFADDCLVLNLDPETVRRWIKRLMEER